MFYMLLKLVLTESMGRLGIGERVGNAAIDQVLMNLKLLGAIDIDLTDLVRYCRTVSRACHWPISKTAGSWCRRFSNSDRVHASAIIKAIEMNDTWLADRVYSGVLQDFRKGSRNRNWPNERQIKRKTLAK